MKHGAFATILSLVFHPFLWISFGIAFVLYQERQAIPKAPQFIAATVLLGTILPAAALWRQRRKGAASNIYLSDQRERTKFNIVGAIITVPILLFSLYYFQFTLPVRFFFWTLTVNIVVYTIITPLLKISAHIGVVTCILLGLSLAYGWPYQLLLPLLLPIAWARHNLRHHSLREILGGFVISSSLTLLAWILLS